MRERIQQRRQRLAAQRASINGAPPPLAVVPFQLDGAQRAALAARVWADAQQRLAENEQYMVIAELVAAAEAAGETITDEEIFELMGDDESDAAEIRQSAELSAMQTNLSQRPSRRRRIGADRIPFSDFFPSQSLTINRRLYENSRSPNANRHRRRCQSGRQHRGSLVPPSTGRCCRR